MAGRRLGARMSSLPSIGRYVVLGELARGGMGVVYRAHDPQLDRDVALKVITTALDPDALRRFQLEGEAAARVRHPNVLAIHELGVHEGRPFLVMDLAAGSLRDRLRSSGPIPADEALALLAPIADALAVLHEAEILHRDLKPENLLLDAEGRPLLADFGIAKSMDRETRYTGSGELLGSPAYMAPEQAKGELSSLDARTDVYGLGAVLYELLTGRPPFVGASVIQLLSQVCEARPTPPRQLVAGLDPGVEAIVLRCLEKNPADRYQSARELADVLSGNAGPSTQPATRRGLAVGILLVGVLGGVGALVAGASSWSAESSPDASTSPTRRGKRLLVVEQVGETTREGMFVLRVAVDPPPSRSLRLELSCAGRKTTHHELPPSGGELTLRCPTRGTSEWTLLLPVVREPATINVTCPDLPEWYLSLPEPPPLLEGLTPADKPEDYRNEKDGSILRWIPPGKGLLKSPFDSAEVQTSGFYLGKFEVTSRQYQAYREWAGLVVVERKAPSGRPAVGVDFHAATRYCRWAGGRLPTILEWNLAGFGGSSPRRKFPWGNAPINKQKHDVDTAQRHPSDVDRRHDVSPEGVVGLGGGVSEWVADRSPQEVAGAGSDHATASLPAAVRQLPTPLRGRMREVRGGSYRDVVESVDAKSHPLRPGVDPSTVDQGFRLVRSARRPEPAHLEWTVHFKTFSGHVAFRERGLSGPSEFTPIPNSEVTRRVLIDPWRGVISKERRTAFATFARAKVELPPGRWVFSVLNADDGIRLHLSAQGRAIGSPIESWQHQVAHHFEAIVQLEELTEVLVEVEHCELDGAESLWVELSRE
ncbi:MAG: protein kinase [Planctomycetes bacterium]|nr:protein kinase [Planctomycetota bacterium]